MSMSVINSKCDGEKTHTRKFVTTRIENSSLKTSDIEGAKPKPKCSNLTNKPDLSNQNWDIERSGPRMLHIGLNKPSYNLAGVAGSKSKCVKFNSKRQYSNPMNPTYNLAKVEARPITPPKFLRDSINHDDIVGSKPKAGTFKHTDNHMPHVKEVVEGS